MSTANFCSMDNFPLWARDFSYEGKFCPKCGVTQDSENDECEFCGYDLSNVEAESFCDEYEARFICDKIEKELEDINCDLIFHKIELKDGYYSGVQFYCETKDFDEDKDGELDIDNDEAHYYYDMCRSQARRKYKSEINKINKILKKIARNYEFDAYGISARFSNGETWYTKIAV
jgi:hypothetical protein